MHMFCMHVCALLTDAAHLLCVVKGGGGFTPFFFYKSPSVLSYKG